MERRIERNVQRKLVAEGRIHFRFVVTELREVHAENADVVVVQFNEIVRIEEKGKDSDS